MKKNIFLLPANGWHFLSSFKSTVRRQPPVTQNSFYSRERKPPSALNWLSKLDIGKLTTSGMGYEMTAQRT